MLILENQKLSEFVTTKIGGIVDKVFLPTNNVEVIEAITICNQNNWSFVILAGGSNTVFADKIDKNQAVICLSKLDKITQEKDLILAQAGAKLQDLVDLAQKTSDSMTSLTRVPGSIGGAVYGNAGAYGTEIADIFEYAIVVKLSDIAKFGNQAPILKLTDCNFGYRDSLFKQDKNYVILEVCLKLKPSIDLENQKYNEISAKRDAIYPQGFKSPGSMFKNIRFSELDPAIQAKIPLDWVVFGDKLPVGRLLEELGLKGFAVEGVKMTDRHPNIFHNFNNGSFANTTKLVSQIQLKVWDKWQIKIEPEVRLIDSNFQDFWL
jgi:UDP-N-acetylmuramate dehydrogenase